VRGGLRAALALEKVGITLGDEERFAADIFLLVGEDDGEDLRSGKRKVAYNIDQVC
jgi:hypothetical protein